MVEINGSTSPVSREQYKQQIAALREERTKLDASARRWDIATKIDTAVAVVALAPLTLLTGCPAPTYPQPPYVPPIPTDIPNDTDPVEGETNPPVQAEGEVAAEGEESAAGGFAIKNLNMTVEEGQRHPNDTSPGGNVGPIQLGQARTGISALGYTNGFWQVKDFVGEANYWGLMPDNIQTEDRDSIAWGTQGKNGNVNSDGSENPEGLQPANVTDASKSVAIINVDSSTVIYPGDWVDFPMILTKGNKINTETGLNYARYLSTTDPVTPETDTNQNGVHDKLESFYPTGLSIAYRRSAPDTQIEIYAYASNDPISGIEGGTGRVLDPRITTGRFYAWAEDKAGIPPMMWGNQYKGELKAVMYNGFPIIGLDQTREAKLAFLSGPTEPEHEEGFGYAVEGAAEEMIPDDGLIYYNLDRNTAFGIEGRTKAGLVYRSPAVISRTYSGRVHSMIVFAWPIEGVGTDQTEASVAVRVDAKETPIPAEGVAPEGE
jgi:hypothetical protein